MPTNNNYTYTPAAVDTGASAPAPIGPLDTGPAAVPPGPGLGIVPGTTRVPVIPQIEQPVQTQLTPEDTTGPNVGAGTQQRYITILANGTVITNNATTLDFEGSGFTIANLGTNGATITMNASDGGYGNSNVGTLLAAFGSNTVSTTGNVTAGYLFGNGSQLTGIVASSSYGNANVVANLAALGSNPMSTTGNVTAGYLFGNGSQLTGLSNIGNLEVVGTDMLIAADATETIINISPSGEGWAYLQLPKDSVANTNNTRLWNAAGNVEIGAGDFSNAGSSYTWVFDQNGGTLFPTLDVQRGDNPSGTITGQTLLFGNNAQEAIISTPDGDVNVNSSSQRLVINPGAGAANTSGEGGDIYLWAGRGGNASGTGGDIKIRGGQGGANTAGGSGGAGGYIRMEAGDAASAGGTAGYIEITSGRGQTGGGNVVIQGGVAQTGNGGPVNIIGGTSNDGLASHGNVTVETGTGRWTFENTGNLQLPPGSTITTPNAVSGTGGYNINIQAGTSDVFSNDPGGNLNLVGGYGAFGDGGGPAGGQVNIVGGGSEDSTDGNVTVSTGGNTWTFDNTGNLTLPGNAFSVNYANGTQVPLGGGSGGNSISDGTSNVTVVATDGNVVIGVDNDAANWTFATDGNIYAKPENNLTLVVSDVNEDGLSLSQIITDGTVQLARTELDADQFRIYTDVQGANHEWRFNGDTLQVTANSLIRGFDAAVTVQSMFAGSTGIASLQSVSNQNDPNVFSTFDATTSAANIKVYNGGSAGGTEHAWQFDNDGNLTLPRSGIVYETSIPFGGLEGNTIALKPSGGIDADQQLLIYPTAIPGTDDNHLHLTTGNLYNTELFLGNDNLYVKLANTGNIVINSNDDVGNTAQWTFGTNGNLTLPGNISGNTAGYAIGYRDIPQVIFAGNTTITATDAGKHYYSTLSTGNVLTIANNASQGLLVGTAISIVNQGTGNITVAQGSGVTLYLAGNATAGNRTVATFGLAKLIKVATDTWFISGTGVE